MPLLPRILAWLTTIVLLGGAWAANSPSEVPTSPSVESGQNQPTIPAGIAQTASEEFTVDLILHIEADIAEQAAIKAAAEAAAAEAARVAEEEAARQAAIEAARPRYQPPTPTVQSTGDVWWDLALCESGANPAANTGNGFYGAFQFMLGTWHGIGGSGYPHEHSYETQRSFAQALQARSGWGQWPACARKLGLL